MVAILGNSNEICHPRMIIIDEKLVYDSLKLERRRSSVKPARILFLFRL